MRKTPKSVFEHKFGRRQFLGTALAGMGAALTAGMPRVSIAGAKTVKLGMNIPMTGDYAPWGLPGLYGCEIVANNLNAAGGIKVGGDTYQMEMAVVDLFDDTE